MSTVFNDHLLRGDHASRPAANAVPQGTLYSCTDHGIIYKSDGVATWSDWATITGAVPGTHATSHQNGGSDEISVTGLSGLLADGQTPLAHKTSHENGGGDEISVAGLSGLLADEQDAGMIKGVTVDDTNIADGRVLVHRTVSGNLEYEDQSGAGGGAADDENTILAGQVFGA